LKHVNREYLTNSSLRERFGIDPKNSATASRIIKETLEAELVKPVEDDMSRKHRKYVPFWA